LQYGGEWTRSRERAVALKRKKMDRTMTPQETKDGSWKVQTTWDDKEKNKRSRIEYGTHAKQRKPHKWNGDGSNYRGSFRRKGEEQRLKLQEVDNIKKLSKWSALVKEMESRLQPEKAAATPHDTPQEQQRKAVETRTKKVHSMTPNITIFKRSERGGGGGGGGG